MSLELGKESSELCHGASKYGFALLLELLESLLDGKFVNQILLSRRIDQRHKIQFTQHPIFQMSQSYLCNRRASSSRLSHAGHFLRFEAVSFMQVFP